jgi:hypothetical protein
MLTSLLTRVVDDDRHKKGSVGRDQVRAIDPETPDRSLR